MQDFLGSGFLTNAGAFVGFVVFVGYVGKLVIEWFRGNKSAENEWRSTAIRDAIAGHEVLKDLFNALKDQVDSLEEDLREAKTREAELIATHRREVTQLRQQYSAKIQELENRIAELKLRIQELEHEARRLGQRQDEADEDHAGE